MGSSNADATAGGSVISLPSGGGAIGGLGETFSADLFTGTGNFSVPITLPSGRNGLAPQLSLGYSTGNGNGPFGLGWAASLPGVTRKTARGVPRYQDGSDDGSPDVFIVSGAEDLVPVADDARGRVRYRPRSEGLFARIEHVRDATGDYWEVRSRDGLLTRYGTPRPTDAAPDWRDPAVTDDRASGGRGRVFAWRITETTDVFGNLVRYTYARDHGEEPGHAWDQPIVSRIEYADYGDRADPSFLVRVEFDYEQRPDPFSDYRSGFEIRTTLRCSKIRISTHAADGAARAVREYRFSYEQAPFNGASQLTRVEVVGIDDQTGMPRHEQLPQLTFGYTAFEPQRRRFGPVTGAGLPTRPLSDPTMAMIDLRGRGLPDIVELGVTARFWRNRGDGRVEPPRTMPQAPPQRLGEPGVAFIDADGDGRADLLVKSATQAGYFPMTFTGGWSRRSFQPYRQAPTVNLDDPHVKLVDLDGDGLTDVIRSGSALECWFNDPDPRRSWRRSVVTNGPAPGIDLADPRVRFADMTGDGLQDVVLLRSGNISYWPNLGHGRFGSPVQMRRAPRLPDGHDPRRLLLGDVDGDGVADLVYVDHGRILLWGNQSGNAWTAEPVTVPGTPDVVDTDAVQFADLHGTGMAGLLFSRGGDPTRPSTLRFLDVTGGRKPYLLGTMDNHLGAHTTVQYEPSTKFLLADEVDPTTRWRTPLPFPVHVVARVDVHDVISSGRLTTEYRYHHGYWDGIEREFRGFAMVEQLDTESFAAGDEPRGVRYSPPTLTKRWFHLGPVATVEAGDWTELDLTHEYWPDDTPMLSRPSAMSDMLAALPRNARRDALRAMRGQMLRSELFALDDSDRQDRPYTVTESLPGVREESPPAADDAARARIFFAFGIGQRTTQWERGIDPMTRFAFDAEPDTYGLATRQLTVAVPRRRDPRDSLTAPAEPYLATVTSTEYARRDDPGRYLVDRVARTTTHEVRNDGIPNVFELRDAVLAGAPAPDGPVSLRVIGHSRTFYDGEPYLGLPLGQLGDHGLPMRSESLMFDNRFLGEHFDPTDPVAVSLRPAYLDPSGTTPWGPEYPDEFQASMPELAGYIHYDDGDMPGSPGGYYTVGARRRYDVHDPDRVPRGLALASLDPLGAESRVSYDHHDLLLTRAIDPVGLMTTVDHDLRTLQPRRVTDPNGNTSRVTFSPTGFVTSSFVSGKNNEGDAAVPSKRLEYDLLAFVERGQPVSVRTITRVHHDTDTDVPVNRRDEEIVSVEYSDGFGRLIQTRTQAEDVLFGDSVFGSGVLPADQAEPVPAAIGRARPPDAPDNVIVSGWQIYDNKGQVVEKYEPFFATGYDFNAPIDAELGRKATMFYDPRGQATRTKHPDGSQQLVVFGAPINLADPDVFAPTSWESFAYDANDNAGRTHGPAAASYRDHWNTPTSTEVDALGRSVIVVARNGVDPDTDWFVTRSAYDVQGNLIALTDALGRESLRCRYDLAGRRWRCDSIDAGRRDTVLAADGAPVESRDGKGAVTFGAFDTRRRPIRVWARDTAADPVTLRQRIDYGDGGDPDQPAADRAAARAHNLLGVAVAHYDEAGLVTVTDVDFKGNVLQTARRVIADAAILAVYERAAPDAWQVTPFRVDWRPAAGQTFAERAVDLLDPDAYETASRFDALNRVVVQMLPSDVDGRRRELRPVYNRAGGLQQVRLDDTLYVERIAYDAKGQRTLIAHGNGVMTRYSHDPDTFRVTRMRSERYSGGDLSYRPTGEPLQDYGYDYDLVGNVVTIRDRTPESGVPDNPEALAAADPAVARLLIGGNALNRHFTYDPVYRLVTATGRECDAPPNLPPWVDRPRGTDITRARAYTETYRYDALGGLRRLDHGGGPGGFSRRFTVDPASNRLQRLRVGQDRYDYTFDTTGNMTSETSSRHFDWSHANRMVAFRTQTGSAEPSVHVHYLYDAAGQRVKKLVRKQGGLIEATHYLGGFEHHRWGPVSNPAQNNRVHVGDDLRRVASVRLGPAHPDDRNPAVQFQLGDHLASTNVVIDDTGTRTRREEYTPYGETSFGSFARKRYRFTGQERDEESGLAYHGARYLQPTLGRFTSVDPAHESYPGWSPFCYALGNPLRFTDHNGMSPSDAEKKAADVASHNFNANVNAIQKRVDEAADIGTQIAAVNREIEVLENLVENGRPAQKLLGEKVTARAALEKKAKDIPSILRGAVDWLDKEGEQLAGKALTKEGVDTAKKTLSGLRQRAQNIASFLTEAVENTSPGSAKWRPQHLQSSGGDPPGRGPSASSRRNTISSEPDAAGLASAGIQGVFTFFNMFNADSAAGVLNAAAEGLIDYLGGLVGGAVFGPPGAVAGSQTSRFVKDPVGTTEAVVHCVFGGYCGDAPFAVWDAFQTAGNAVVGCVFGGNCGDTAAAISDAILRPAPSIDVLRARMRAQRR